MRLGRLRLREGVDLVLVGGLRGMVRLGLLHDGVVGDGRVICGCLLGTILLLGEQLLIGGKVDGVCSIGQGRGGGSMLVGS